MIWLKAVTKNQFPLQTKAIYKAGFINQVLVFRLPSRRKGFGAHSIKTFDLWSSPSALSLEKFKDDVKKNFREPGNHD